MDETNPTETKHQQDMMVMLARVDERTNSLLVEVRSLKESTVSKAEFSPVKSLVYGLVAIMMTSVVVAMVSLVLRAK